MQQRGSATLPVSPTGASESKFNDETVRGRSPSEATKKALDTTKKLVDLIADDANDVKDPVTYDGSDELYVHIKSIVGSKLTENEIGKQVRILGEFQYGAVEGTNKFNTSLKSAAKNINLIEDTLLVNETLTIPLKAQVDEIR
jgi:hypothetical protein